MLSIFIVTTVFYGPTIADPRHKLHNSRPDIYYLTILLYVSLKLLGNKHWTLSSSCRNLYLNVFRSKRKYCKDASIHNIRFSTAKDSSWNQVEEAVLRGQRFKGCDTDWDDVEDPALMVVPRSSKSMSGVSQYRDFIRALPVGLAKRILGERI